MADTKESKAATHENLFVVLPVDDHEQKVMREWWDERYPQSKAKLITELRVQRLTDAHYLVGLSRLPPERPKFQRLDGGAREALPSDQPVRASQPIAVREYWTETTDEGGRIDHLRLIRDLAKQVHPLRVTYRGDTQTIRVLPN